MGPYIPITRNAQLLNYSRLQGYKMIKDESIKFSELITEMQRVKNKWRHIGVCLGIKTVQLDSINAMAGGDSRVGLQEVMREWVCTAQNHEVDLSLLIKACAYPSGGNNQGLANKIAKEYGAYIRIYGTQMYNDTPNEVKINMSDRETPAAESLMPDLASSEEHGSTGIQAITLSEFVEELREVRTRWERIGIQLRIDPNDLEEIRRTHRDCRRALTAMLHLWVSASGNSEVDLSLLIKAIYLPAGGSSQAFALNLAKKYRLNTRREGRVLKHCDPRKIKINLPDLEVQATDHLGGLQEKFAKLSSDNMKTKQHQQKMGRQLSNHENRIKPLEKESQDGAPQKKRAKIK